MAFILVSILTKKVPTWNKVVFTQDEVDRLSSYLLLPILEDEAAKAKGEYIADEGLPYIVLKPGLKPPDKLWVSLHEVGHHLMHYPVNHKFSKGVQKRMDREANFFAAIAMIPTFLITSKGEMPISQALAEIAEEYNYPKELIKIRQEIYENYKI